MKQSQNLERFILDDGLLFRGHYNELVVVYKCKKIQISIKCIKNQKVIDLDEYNHFKLIYFEEMFGR